MKFEIEQTNNNNNRGVHGVPTWPRYLGTYVRTCWSERDSVIDNEWLCLCIRGTVGGGGHYGGKERGERREKEEKGRQGAVEADERNTFVFSSGGLSPTGVLSLSPRRRRRDSRPDRPTSGALCGGSPYERDRPARRRRPSEQRVFWFVVLPVLPGIFRLSHILASGGTAAAADFDSTPSSPPSPFFFLWPSFPHEPRHTTGHIYDIPRRFFFPPSIIHHQQSQPATLVFSSIVLDNIHTHTHHGQRGYIYKRNNGIRGRGKKTQRGRREEEKKEVHIIITKKIQPSRTTSLELTNGRGSIFFFFSPSSPQAQ